jgi:ATP-dependent DNA ligase
MFPLWSRLISTLITATGYYKGEDLIYVARARNDLVPASRRTVSQRLRDLRTDKCPFTNLPETRKARWGEAMTTEKMNECVWVRPELVAQIEFLEWTDANNLRHSEFVAPRDDKDAREVVKEGQSICRRKCHSGACHSLTRHCLPSASFDNRCSATSALS